jgi:hypothetical protein
VAEIDERGACSRGAPTVSAERDELMRLIRDLPEDQVPQTLAEVRRHLRPVKDRPWPPAFFASAPGDGKRIADEAEELLRESFRPVAQVIVRDTRRMERRARPQSPWPRA